MLRGILNVEKLMYGLLYESGNVMQSPDDAVSIRTGPVTIPAADGGANYSSH